MAVFLLVATGVRVVAILEVPLLVVVLVDVLARLTIAALSALLLFLLLLKLPLGLDALVFVESMSDALFLARGLLLIMELNLLRRHLDLLLVLSMRV